MADSRNLIRPVGIPQLEVRMEGNWLQVTNMVNELPLAVYQGYEKGTNNFIRKLDKVIKRSIITGTPPEGSGITWRPLSPNTIKRYGRHGIYNMTGAYLRSIGVQRTRRGSIFLGISQRERHPTHGKLTIIQVANILEKGTNDGRIPARPLWSPSFAAVGGRKALRNTIIKSIRSSLLAHGFRYNQIRIKTW